jgi:hypothetical protein
MPIKANFKPKINMETLLKLTKVRYDSNTKTVKEEPILIGVESIISVEGKVIEYSTSFLLKCTEINSRAAMVTSFNVKESVEEIYQLYKNQ